MKFFYSILLFTISSDLFAAGTQFAIETKVYRDPVTYIAVIFCALICFFVTWTSRIKNRHIMNLSFEDELTGLYTPKKFKAEVSKILRQNPDKEFSIVCVDINKFRYITESFGSNIGNSILVELANTIKQVVPQESVVCRNFVDNFSILLHTSSRNIIEDYVVNMTDINKTISKLLPSHYLIEFNVGVYKIIDHHEDIQKIMDKANVARIEGKKSIDPRRISFFEETMGNSSNNEKDITFDMNRAFENNEFVVYYQPKYDFQTSRIIGAEALVRWIHNKKGLISPGDFVPVFEKNGFISKIDTMVFENVCRLLDRWNKKGTQDKPSSPITISCNLSRVQLYNPNVVREYSAIASKYALWPSQVEIELTESLMMDNKNRLIKVMNEIRKAGFSISVDDFGSGFSSLSLLKDIPATVLKLDKEFLANDTAKEHIIIDSVISMAKKLNITTVAEGVEDEKQRDFLREKGCDIAQGFFYAKPMPEKEFELLLEKSFY